MPKNNPSKRKAKRNRRRRAPNTVRTFAAIPRNLRGSSPFPESMVVKLTCSLNFAMAGASTWFIRDYRLNSLFAFDVVGGGTNDFSGVTQLAAIYDSYHVQSFKVKFILCGNETGQPVFFGLTFKDDQPSVTVTNFTHAVNALEVSPTTGPLMTGQTTGMEIYRSRQYSMHCGDIVGNRLSYNSDLSYTASFGSNPSQAVWMGAIAYTVGGNATNGVIVNLHTELTVRVYSIKVLQE